MARTYTGEFKKACPNYLKVHPDMLRKETVENLWIPKDTLYGWYKVARKKSYPDAYDENGRHLIKHSQRWPSIANFLSGIRIPRLISYGGGDGYGTKNIIQKINSLFYAYSECFCCI